MIPLKYMAKSEFKWIVGLEQTFVGVIFPPKVFKERRDGSRNESGGTGGAAERRAGAHSGCFFTELSSLWQDQLCLLFFTGENKKCRKLDQVCGGDSCSSAGAAEEQGGWKQPTDRSAAGTLSDLKYFMEDVEHCNTSHLLQSLEKSLIEQKTEINGLNHHISTLTKKAENVQESLKKACQAQKLRAEKFEAAVEKCYDELKEKVRWCKISIIYIRSSFFHMLNSAYCLGRDTGSPTNQRSVGTGFQKAKKREDEGWDGQSRSSRWLVEEVRCPSFRQKSCFMVETNKWFCFWSEVSDLTARLQREKNNHVAATETLMQQVKRLTTENGELSASNASLQVDVSSSVQNVEMTCFKMCDFVD